MLIYQDTSTMFTFFENVCYIWSRVYAQPIVIINDAWYTLDNIYNLSCFLWSEEKKPEPRVMR